MDILIKVIQLFLCFTLLVGIHELGHFLMARVFGIRVEKFYIFFDPWFSLFKFKRGGTEYGVQFEEVTLPWTKRALYTILSVVQRPIRHLL